MYHLHSGEVQLALDLATKILDDANASATLPFVSRVAGTCNFLLGNLDQSRRYLQRSLTLLETAHHDPDLFLCGADLATETNSWLAVALSLGGKQGEAEDLIAATIASAQKLDHPYSLAFALGAAKVVYHYGEQFHLPRGYDGRLDRVG